MSTNRTKYIVMFVFLTIMICIALGTPLATASQERTSDNNNNLAAWVVFLIQLLILNLIAFVVTSAIFICIWIKSATAKNLANNLLGNVQAMFTELLLAISSLTDSQTPKQYELISHLLRAAKSFGICLLIGGLILIAFIAVHTIIVLMLYVIVCIICCIAFAVALLAIICLLLSPESAGKVIYLVKIV